MGAPALLRPGPYNRSPTADPHRSPSVPPSLPLSPPQAVASATEGFSGAELANVVNEATLLAARDARDAVRPGGCGGEGRAGEGHGRAGGGGGGQHWVGPHWEMPLLLLPLLMPVAAAATASADCCYRC